MPASSNGNTVSQLTTLFEACARGGTTPHPLLFLSVQMAGTHVDRRNDSNSMALATSVVRGGDKFEEVTLHQEFFDAKIERRLVYPSSQKHKKHSSTWLPGRSIDGNMWIAAEDFDPATVGCLLGGGWSRWCWATKDSGWSLHHGWWSLCCRRQSGFCWLWLFNWLVFQNAALPRGSGCHGSDVLCPRACAWQNPAAPVPVYAVFFQASRFDDFLLRFDVFSRNFG